jgi:hypothetical protein
MGSDGAFRSGGGEAGGRLSKPRMVIPHISKALAAQCCCVRLVTLRCDFPGVDGWYSRLKLDRIMMTAGGISTLLLAVLVGGVLSYNNLTLPDVFRVCTLY